MGDVISLQERREKRSLEEHARALVLFECAAILARRRHSALLRVVEDAFTPEEIEDRVQATMTPRRMVGTERYVARRGGRGR
jgi:hypothetical protein